jgi:nucleotide-binding universal stress UspA family protein
MHQDPMLEPRPDTMSARAVALPFRAVVLGTDFSPAVRGAEAYAAQLADRNAAELVVVHAFTLAQPALEAEALAHRASVQREDLMTLLERTAADARTRVMRLLFEGAAVDVIRRASAEYSPSLVVIGTHGPGAIERRLVGSTAEGILRTIEAPVLTVGPRVTPPSTLTFRHILYATDYSEAAAHAGQIALEWSKAFGGNVDVLHAAPDATAGMHQRILDRASLCGADLIVLGAHRHSHLSMHVRTGPAFHVILEARCPVLTVSGSAAQEAR